MAAEIKIPETSSPVASSDKGQVPVAPIKITPLSDVQWQERIRLKWANQEGRSNPKSGADYFSLYLSEWVKPDGPRDLTLFAIEKHTKDIHAVADEMSKRNPPKELPPPLSAERAEEQRRIGIAKAVADFFPNIYLDETDQGIRFKNEVYKEALKHLTPATKTAAPSTPAVPVSPTSAPEAPTVPAAPAAGIPSPTTATENTQPVTQSASAAPPVQPIKFNETVHPATPEEVKAEYRKYRDQIVNEQPGATYSPEGKRSWISGKDGEFYYNNEGKEDKTFLRLSDHKWFIAQSPGALKEVQGWYAATSSEQLRLPDYFQDKEEEETVYDYKGEIVSPNENGEHEITTRENRKFTVHSPRLLYSEATQVQVNGQFNEAVWQAQKYLRTLVKDPRLIDWTAKPGEKLVMSGGEGPGDPIYPKELQVIFISLEGRSDRRMSIGRVNLMSDELYLKSTSELSAEMRRLVRDYVRSQQTPAEPPSVPQPPAVNPAAESKVVYAQPALPVPLGNTYEYVKILADAGGELAPIYQEVQQRLGRVLEKENEFIRDIAQKRYENEIAALNASMKASVEALNAAPTKQEQEVILKQLQQQHLETAIKFNEAAKDNGF